MQADKFDKTHPYTRLIYESGLQASLFRENKVTLMHTVSSKIELAVTTETLRQAMKNPLKTAEVAMQGRAKASIRKAYTALGLPMKFF